MEDQTRAIKAAYGIDPLASIDGSEETNIDSTQRWTVVCNHYIHLFFLCKELRCLPRDGGLDDQDWIVAEAFSVISQEYLRIKNEALQNARKY